MCSRFLLTLRNMGYLGTLIMVIFFVSLLKGNMGYLPICFKGYGILVPPIQSSRIATVLSVATNR